MKFWNLNIQSYQNFLNTFYNNKLKKYKYGNISRNLWISQQTFVGLQYLLKTSSRHLLKTSSTRRQYNNFLSSKYILNTSCKDVLKRSWKLFEDISQVVLKTKNCNVEEVLKTSSRHVLKRRRLLFCREDVLETNKMFTGDICI